MANMWMVRSQGGELLPFFLEKKVVALGWRRIGNLSGKNKQTLKEELYEAYPEDKKAVFAWVGFIENFLHVMKEGDFVLTYDSSLREYHIGEVISDYKYDPKQNPEWPNIRNVKWNSKTISRDLLSSSTRNSLGSPQTLFKASKEAEQEIKLILENKAVNKKNEQEIAEEVELQSGELLENSTETLKDRILSLSPDNMEELIKEILNAMGYIARRSPKGADRGIDVFASKDGLGLEEPRIFVEVKHRKGQMGAPDLRTFLGGRQTGDRCIYVSTGGFTKDARYEAERAKIPLSLVDLDMLAELITLHYDNFRAEGKVLLPLRKVYLPA